MSLFDKNNSTVVKAKKVVEKEEKSMESLYNSKNDSKEKQQKKPEKKIFKYGQAYKILQKPLVTEKVTNLGIQNKYVFIVDNDANKIEIAKAIYQIYRVKPIKVNIVKSIGKKIRRGKISGKRRDWKKAIITLAKGETIKIYEGV